MPRLWVTYAWKDNEDGDFDHLVSALRDAGVDVQFDKVELVPGQRLWEQLGELITSDDLDGWAYLVTPASLASQPCREELEYAISQALRREGFPLIALVHGVDFAELPQALKVRLGISMSEPDWVEGVVAALEGRSPSSSLTSTPNLVLTRWTGYGGSETLTALELRPRFGEVHAWRVGLPVSVGAPKAWGTGPAGSGRITTMTSRDAQEGARAETGDGATIGYFGEAGPLTPGFSAYVVFDTDLPAVVYFGEGFAPAEWIRLEI